MVKPSSTEPRGLSSLPVTSTTSDVRLIQQASVMADDGPMKCS